MRAASHRRTGFHPLPVAGLDRLTEDSLAITFQVPEPLREAYAFRPGQHVTVELPTTGEQVRRSYSVCSTPAQLAATGILRIGVKEIPGGVFSAYAASKLAVGDEVRVLPPLGHFTTDLRPDRSRWYVALAAGSGITPVLSLVTAALATEPASRFTVFYGNRYARSVMFADELADAKDRWPDRLQVVHVLSREPGPAELLSGRIDAERLPRLLATFLPARVVTDPATEWFLCGPYQMVLDARAVLADHGVSEQRVRTELFHVPDEQSGTPPPAAPAAGGGCELTVVLDGRASSVTMRPGERVLDAALRARAELPYSCRGGVCATCRARVVEGEVRMARDWALEPAERAAGYVLTCQSSPVSDRLTVDYDA